jgi:hypothetical protein
MVSLFTLLDPSEFPKLGWTSLTVCLKSNPSTEQRELKLYRLSWSFLRRSLCIKNKIIAFSKRERERERERGKRN